MYKNTAQPTVAGLHQGTTMQSATSGTRDNRAPTRLNRAAMRYPAPPSASYRAGTPFHRSPYLPRCTGARSAPQATPPANFSILAPAVGGIEKTRAVHGSCRDVVVGD